MSASGASGGKQKIESGLTSFGQKETFVKHKQGGSRAVGGKKPHNVTAYNRVESVRYLIADTKDEEASFAEISSSQREFREQFLWALYAVIGVTVALVIIATLAACDWILKKRAYATRDALVKDDLVGAWLIWTGSSLGLCLVALMTVLFEPACASSGIPALIAYLNGVMPKGGKSPLTGQETSFISWQTMCAKLVGMICSIPSGLCVGPEGPIIHISALIGHWSTKLAQRCERHWCRSYKFNAAASEARDFLATGAACGICVAFRAPLAGCLFVVEEAASFFSTRHLEYTFFACLFAFFVAKILADPDDGFTKFKQATGFFCDSNFTDGFDLLMFLILAIIGGTLGALFNQIVEHLSHLRVHHVNGSAVKRSVEVVCLVLITGTVAVLLPAAFECEKELRELLMKDSVGCLNNDDFHQIAHGSATREHLLGLLTSAHDGFQGSNTSMPAELAAMYANLKNFKPVAEAAGEQVWRDSVMLDNNINGTAKYIHVHYPHAFTCKPGSHSYNGMAMLWLNGGVKGVKVLMQRGFPHLLSIKVLAVFCPVYFILAAITSGCSVPAGLVVPMLLIGGSFGRLVGLIGLELKRDACLGGLAHDPTNAYYWSTAYRWIGRDCNLPDPGVFAVVGMASFLGGSGRITVFLATMMVELTGDAAMIAPVGVVCILAMIVGNHFNHGLYHGLIPVFSLPFLNSDPSDVMYVSRVAEVMVQTADVVALPKRPTTLAVKTLLEKWERGVSGECICSAEDKQRREEEGCPACTCQISHNAFPVVDSESLPRLRGIIEIDQLRDALHGKKHEINKHMSMKKIPTIHLDLMDHADRSPITVFTHTKVARAFDIFRKLGLRHLCVIDAHGLLKGIITRKNLQTYKLKENICREEVEAMLRGWIVRWRQRQTMKLLMQSRVTPQKTGSTRVEDTEWDHTLNSMAGQSRQP